jgi:hypothetical protein
MKLSISDFLNPVTSCLSPKYIPQPSVLKHLQPATLLGSFSTQSTHHVSATSVRHPTRVDSSQKHKFTKRGFHLFTIKHMGIKVCFCYRLATTYNENILFKNMICNLKLWSSTRVLTSALTDWLMVNRLQYFSRSIHSMYIWSAKYVNCKWTMLLNLYIGEKITYFNNNNNKNNMTAVDPWKWTVWLKQFLMWRQLHGSRM